MIYKKNGLKEKLSQKTNYIQNRIMLVCIVFTLFFVFCVFSMNMNNSVVVDYSNSYIVYNTLLSAHRAGAGDAPENTLKAFSQVINSTEYKVDILEFDLHLTKDNRLVLIHDDTLDRTSNAREFFGKRNIRVKDKTYEELKQLNMAEFFVDSQGKQPYKGLRGNNISDDIKIVSLDEILDYLKDKGEYHYIIEIKNNSSLGKYATDLLYDILNTRNLLSKTIVGSFNGEILKYIDEKYPNIIRSACSAEAFSFYLNYKFNIDIEKIILPFKILQLPDKDYGVNFVKGEFINYAHKYGIAVQYWIEDENKKDTESIIEKTKAILNIKADAIITDNPKIAYDLMKDDILVKFIEKIKEE